MAEPAMRLPVLDEPGKPSGEEFRDGPNLAVAGTDPDLLSRMGWKDGKPPEEQKTESPAPAPAAPAAPTWDPAQFSQAIAQGQFQAQMAAQQARDAQAAQERAQVEYQRRMAQVFTPPSLPNGEDADKLIADPEALKKAFAERDAWYQRGLMTMGEAVAAQTQAQMGQMAQQLYAPIYQMRAENAMNSAQDKLYAMGFDQPDQILGELETRLRGSDPNAYWNVVTNPESLVMGAQILAQSRGMFPNTNVTAPVSVGYTPSYPTQRGVSSASLPPVLAEAVRKTEAALGRKMSPASIQTMVEKYENGEIR